MVVKNEEESTNVEAVDQRGNNLDRKAVIAKDIQNLKCARRGQNEAIQLLQEMNNLKAKYGAKVLPITDENKELQILFFQTPHKQQAFKCFPEVVLLDATYRTNKLRMPLFAMVVQDGSGLSHVVAYAFVASEQQQEEVTLSNHEKDEVQAPENSTCQGVGSGDTLHIDGAQKLLNQSQASVITGPSMSGNDTGSSANKKCSVGPSISGRETRSSANQEGTASSPVNEIKLPLVKSRGCPSKRVLQSRLKQLSEQDDGRPVPVKQLSEKSQTQLILSGLIGDGLCPRVLDGVYILQEHDLEVHPEVLPSALLDCRVSLP
ncbi:hypothetical protein MRX96_039011 [Rhipicephalus microplus]